MAERRKSERGGALLLALALSGGVTAASPAGSRVYFSDGRSIEVASFRVDGDQAVLALPGGGLVILHADRILRVEAIRNLEPGEPDQAGQSPTPVPPERPASPAPASVPAAPPGDDQPAGRSIDTLIRRAAERHGLEADLLAAVIAVESGFQPTAVSPKGAMGLMQLMPGTARELAVTNPFDPAQSIDAGARYLRQLLDANDGKYWRALAAYNAGSGRVARYGGLPPYRETIDYIRRVLNNYASPRPVPFGPVGSGLGSSLGSSEPSRR